ncbi:hypothetical protein PG991_007251 [Apiospora marii]|uniref:Uncharacterized protein n=1 Tax=Apiospora marii TaxID=335849 RepID=A0ABR1RSX5_9PEZI
MRLISTDLELIKTGLRQVVRRDPGISPAQCSLKLIGGVQSSLSILIDLMDSRPDDPYVPGLFIDIGTTLGGLNGYLLEIDQLIAKKDEQCITDHDQKVSRINFATEKITLGMSYQAKAAIDSLNSLYETETGHVDVSGTLTFINSVLDEIESGFNEVIDQGYDHRPAESVVELAETVRAELKMVPAELRRPESKDTRVKSWIVRDLFGMISDLLSLGQLIEETDAARMAGQDDGASSGETCQCERCLLEELDEAFADLRLLTAHWTKDK